MQIMNKRVSLAGGLFGRNSTHKRLMMTFAAMGYIAAFSLCAAVFLCPTTNAYAANDHIYFTNNPPGSYFLSNETVALYATAESGLAITWQVTSGSAQTNVSGGLTNLQFTGTGIVTLVAYSPGNGSWTATNYPTNYIVSLTKQDQSVSLTNVPSGTSFSITNVVALYGSTSSGLPVVFWLLAGNAHLTTNTTDGATNWLVFDSTGDVQVAAYQAGNHYWNPKLSDVVTYTVSRAVQTVSFTNVPDGLDFTYTNDVTLYGTATSGMLVTFAVTGGSAHLTTNAVDGATNVLLFDGTGIVSVVAYQGGNSFWAEAESATKNYTVTKANQIAGFTNVPAGTNFTYTDTVQLYGTATSQLPVIFGVAFGPAHITNNNIDGATNLLAFDGTGVVGVACAQAGNSNWNSFAGDATNYMVFRAEQVVTFTNDPNGSNFLWTNTLVLYGTATSRLPVTFSVVAGNAHLTNTFDGWTNVLVFDSTGSVEVVAYQDGAALWSNGVSAQKTYNLFRLPQVVGLTNFPAGTNFTYTNTVALYGTATSGLPVTCNVVAGSAHMTTNNIDGWTNVVVFDGTGVVGVVAYQDGDATWSNTESGVTNYFVGRASQHVGLTNDPAGTNFHTTNTVALYGTAASVLPVSYNVVSGNAHLTTNEIDGTTNVVVFDGAGEVGVAAYQDGSEFWLAGVSGTTNFFVTKTVQSVSFTNYPAGSNFVFSNVVALYGTATSRLPVVFIVLDGSAHLTTNTSDGATNWLVFDSTGGVRVACYQSGNAIWESALSDVTNYVVSKAAQSITFSTTPTSYVQTATVELSAVASSGLPCTYEVVSGPGTINYGSVTNLTFSDTGEVVVAAQQAGDGNWDVATPVTNRLLVTQAGLEIVPSEFTYVATNGAALPASQTFYVSNVGIVACGFTSLVTYSAGESGWYSNSPACTGMLNVGESLSFAGYVSTASVPGIYSATCTLYSTTVPAAPAVSFVITLNYLKGEQLIDFTAIPNQAITNRIVLSATATSEEVVTFAIASGPATISGSTNVSFSGVGSVYITADQAGNDYWNAAPTVTNHFRVTNAVTITPAAEWMLLLLANTNEVAAAPESSQENHSAVSAWQTGNPNAVVEDIK